MPLEVVRGLTGWLACRFMGVFLDPLSPLVELREQVARCGSLQQPLLALDGSPSGAVLLSW